jgi:hypothetical protein
MIKHQCPYCQAEGIAAGTSNKILLDKPYMDLERFTVHVVKHHAIGKLQAQSIFKNKTS